MAIACQEASPVPGTLPGGPAETPCEILRKASPRRHLDVAVRAMTIRAGALCGADEDE